jgi:hypothetical protein
MRFAFLAPWFIDDEGTSSGYVALWNFVLTEAEAQRRDSVDFYGLHDDEGKIEVTYGPAEHRNLAQIRRQTCRVENTTVKVRQCTTTRIHGRTADWILFDESNDGDCTCRLVVFVVAGHEYRFSGGGCIDCAHTPGLLRQIDQMFRTVVISR